MSVILPIPIENEFRKGEITSFDIQIPIDNRKDMIGNTFFHINIPSLFFLKPYLLKGIFLLSTCDSI